MRGLLYLVKNNECLPSDNRLTGMGFDITHDAAWFQVVEEQIPGKTVISTIDINYMFIFIVSELH